MENNKKYQVILKNKKNGDKLFNSIKAALKSYSPNEIKKIVVLEIMEEFDSADGRNVSSNKVFHQRKYK
jgi:hypothetical protein